MVTSSQTFTMLLFSNHLVVAMVAMVVGILFKALHPRSPVRMHDAGAQAPCRQAVGCGSAVYTPCTAQGTVCPREISRVEGNLMVHSVVHELLILRLH